MRIRTCRLRSWWKSCSRSATLSRSPLFQVVLTLQNAPRSRVAAERAAVAAEWRSGEGTAKFDLTLAGGRARQGLDGCLEYNTELFEAETIRKVLGALRSGCCSE